MKKISLWMILLLIYISCGGCGGSTSGGGSSSQQKIVFAGDSLTAWGNWSSYFGIPIINDGVVGIESSDLLNTIAGYVASKPTKIFIMIGTNDVLRGNPGNVVGNISSIIDKIHAVSPTTIIYIQSILPMQWADKCTIIQGLNSQIWSLCAAKRVVFISLYGLFTDPATVINWTYYQSDGYHLTDAGYQVWENAISGYVF